MSDSAASIAMRRKVMLLYTFYLKEPASSRTWPRAVRDLLVQMLTMAKAQHVDVDEKLFQELCSSGG